MELTWVIIYITYKRERTSAIIHRVLLYNQIKKQRLKQDLRVRGISKMLVPKIVPSI